MGGVGGYVGKYVGVWGEVRKDRTKHRMGPYGTAWDRMGTVWALMGPYGPLWAPYGHLWDRMGPYGHRMGTY